ncbi:hypothetical protein G9C85_17535 [Halorubellus sp. JP-L1]|uniref:hypothetical protein n=1 Tax=Halorubellus sp. JP-L1 TaxID=2715753 RepID=UPI00140E4F54|nr:hypothetical protein [Halorubellus sp. JP-L1]NHN43423.1 hypothetical protein [Halorubellus sp. JP-L1]
MREDGEPEPIRKIDDATDVRPPQSALGRRWLSAKRWFLLDADRVLVTALLLSGVFATILFAGTFGPGGVESFLTTGVSPGSVLVELMKSIVSVVVIVLSINQLVLSPGLGPVGEQRERYEQSVELREQVAELTGVRVSPASASTFLDLLLAEIAESSSELETAVSRYDGEDGELAERTSLLVRDVVAEAAAVRELVEASEFGEFDVVSASLRFAITEKVRSVRELHGLVQASAPADPGEEFESLDEAFDDLEDLFEFFTVAREYMKTVYLREEYIGLSQALLYVGLPAVVASYVASQVYAPDVFPGQVWVVDAQLLFVSAAVTVALAPFTLLIAYVFRLATLSRSTLFVGPFDARPPDAEHEEERRHDR